MAPAVRVSIPPPPLDDMMEIDNPSRSQASTPERPSNLPPSNQSPRNARRTVQDCTPLELSSRKLILLIRHGTALHNHHNVDLKSPQFFDARLDEHGEHQSLLLGTRYRKGVERGSDKAAELVVCSPLTRCLQTAYLAFGLGVELGGGVIGRGAPVVVHEALREAHGIHTPDRRRPLSDLQRSGLTTNVIDYINVTETDNSWRPDKRESLSELSRRITSFMKWLTGRPEKRIVIVTHGVWIEQCLRQYKHTEYLSNGKRIGNAEVLRCELMALRRDEEGLVLGDLYVKKVEGHKKFNEGEQDERSVLREGL